MSDELFATGVTLVEQALESDDDIKHLQDKIQQQQEAVAAAEKAAAEEAARWGYVNCWLIPFSLIC